MPLPFSEHIGMRPPEVQDLRIVIQHVIIFNIIPSKVIAIVILRIIIGTALPKLFTVINDRLSF